MSDNPERGYRGDDIACLFGHVIYCLVLGHNLSRNHCPHLMGYQHVEHMCEAESKVVSNLRLTKGVVGLEPARGVHIRTQFLEIEVAARDCKCADVQAGATRNQLDHRDYAVTNVGEGWFQAESTELLA